MSLCVIKYVKHEIRAVSRPSLFVNEFNSAHNWMICYAAEDRTQCGKAGIIFTHQYVIRLSVFTYDYSCPSIRKEAALHKMPPPKTKRWTYVKLSGTLVHLYNTGLCLLAEILTYFSFPISCVVLSMSWPTALTFSGFKNAVCIWSNMKAPPPNPATMKPLATPLWFGNHYNI